MHDSAKKHSGLFDLSGKVALVTGGSSGIGQLIAYALSDAGADIVVIARRRESLENTVDSIKNMGRKAACFSVDLSQKESIEELSQKVPQLLGAPDILVNAAGVNLRQPFDEITIESWNKTIWLNLSAPFFIARELVSDMKKKKWGRIINIASLQSVRAFANSMPYGASKGGICQLTRAMAEAWSPFGITCNAIAPGFFPTELTAPVFQNEVRASKLASQTAIGRNGRLEDLSGSAVFLAAPGSEYITGQTLFVDGGFTAK